jgi:sulfur-oxidizing protein SoxX
MTMLAALLMAATASSFASPAAAAAGERSTWEGDAIAQPLTSTPGDARRGRAIVTNRQLGLCLLCHSGPFPEEPSAGNLATDLAGAGARWSEAQLRARIVDARRLDPSSLMPAFHSTGGNRVGTAWRGRPILDAQQVEDVVAFLKTLR